MPSLENRPNVSGFTPDTSPHFRSERETFLDKVVLVTGGSRGIGKETAYAFARRGAKLAINSTHQSEEQALDVLDSVREFGVEAAWFPGDLRNPQEAERVVAETVRQYGRLDVLINNAGVTADNLLVRMSDEEWDKVISTNLTGTFNVTRPAVKQMAMGQRPRGGSLVFVSSVSAEGNKGQANYAAAKAGVEALARTIALEYAARGIKVGIIAPGLVDTGLAAKLNEQQIQGLLDLVGQERMLQPSDVAESIVDLARAENTEQKITLI